MTAALPTRVAHARLAAAKRWRPDDAAAIRLAELELRVALAADATAAALGLLRPEVAPGD